MSKKDFWHTTPKHEVFVPLTKPAIIEISPMERAWYALESKDMRFFFEGLPNELPITKLPNGLYKSKIKAYGLSLIDVMRFHFLKQNDHIFYYFFCLLREIKLTIEHYN